MKKIDTIIFDVFGTLLDWKGTIVSEGLRLFPHLSIDWEAFAVEWMKEYGRSVSRLKEWHNLDHLLSIAYGPLAQRFEIGCDSPAVSSELATIWSRLKAWPDATSGLNTLKESYLLGAFSNANLSMQAALRESSGLPWDYLLSAESVHKYKPDPLIYQMALKETRREADEVLLVASHTFDLNAANLHGIHTALISRPGEPGSDPAGLDHMPLVVTKNLDDFANFMLRK